jgi:hypothetical protein
MLRPNLFNRTPIVTEIAMSVYDWQLRGRPQVMIAASRSRLAAGHRAFES